MQTEPYVDESGEQVGWVVVDDEGSTFLAELDGEVVAQWDADAEGWAAFEDQDDDDGGYDLGGLDSRLDQLEARIEQPRPVEMIMGMEQADLGRWDADMSQQRAHLES